MLLGVESPAVHGGMFVVPMMNKPLVFLMCLGIGSLITGVIYAFLKRPVDLNMIDDD